jgi:hypothetical protein
VTRYGLGAAALLVPMLPGCASPDAIGNRTPEAAIVDLFERACLSGARLDRFDRIVGASALVKGKGFPFHFRYPHQSSWDIEKGIIVLRIEPRGWAEVRQCSLLIDIEESEKNSLRKHVIAAVESGPPARLGRDHLPNPPDSFVACGRTANYTSCYPLMRGPFEYWRSDNRFSDRLTIMEVGPGKGRQATLMDIEESVSLMTALRSIGS